MNELEQIEKLKKEKNAVILAHYYVDEEVQKCADYIGDSYYLSKVATELTSTSSVGISGVSSENLSVEGSDKKSVDKIIFAGVKFMGESAKLLNPEKRVFMPDADADCPMAHMATAEEIAEIREKYPDVAVVCYINSTAELKTLSDVCVTSANAVKIVRNLPNKTIFFIPDGNLGNYVREQVPEKTVITNNGFCPRHVAIRPDGVKKAKEAHPNAKFAVHPECIKEVLEMADFVGSTSAIIKYITESDVNEFIVGTVDGVFAKINELAPEKKLYRVNDEQICVNMKKVTLEKIIDVLENETNEVFLDEEVAKKALIPLERMLELAK